MYAMDVIEQIAALRRQRQPFVLATVVSRQAPVSAHLGDRAIVFPDGRMEGFVGGACSREIIRRQALEVFTLRQPRLVSIRPAAVAQDGVSERAPERVIVPMTCASEGAIDVYVEPFVPARRLIVAGATPIAAAVARLARTLEYDVVRAVEEREHRDVEAEAVSLGISVVTLENLPAAIEDGAARGVEQAAVIASQGHYEGGVAYVGLVASRRRGASVSALLQKGGSPRVDSIRYPAGLDLGARTPSEVALSILAEIVQVGSTARPAALFAVGENRAATAVDPVCGMSVEIAGARHRADIDGTSYYFCCAACRSQFLTDPQRAHP
jgi:xanthine dehydrogenase accessory factor